ncbi:Ctr copper transporter family-domain-containing protein [Glomus cerebriforme]|uniref:Copper transport protein n=1 Tax=Glomus cerebriforme TaxID=658196 RepID=A0A397SV65_9GLOM|nr:Ctr copper transporter family-domain-containing protein [Glomus cerebriforme]
MDSQQFIIKATMNYGHEEHDIGEDNIRPFCSMKMLFNWDSERLCIIFSWWRVNNIGFLILSCFIIAALAASFEFLRFILRKYDSSIYSSSHSQLQEGRDTEEIQSQNNDEIRITFVQQLVRTLIHTFQVTLSFLLMLVFMTYNGFLMISVIVGAAIGYFFFAKHTISSHDLGGRSITCH